MKYLIFLFAFLLIGFKISMSTDQIPDSECVVNKLLGQIANHLSKKFNMNPIATNVAMPREVVKLLGLNFQLVGPLTKEELRKILVNSAQDFLSSINADKDIQSYLERIPFQINNIGITLFIIDSTGIEVDHPFIGIAKIREGKIEYLTLITTDIPNLKTEEKETYEEALKAL